MNLKWRFGESEELLSKEVEGIVGDATVEELLGRLPSDIPFSDSQNAHLTIRKLGSIVYQVSYVVYKDPGNTDFEKVSVLFTTQPDLRLALYEMLLEVEKVA